MQPHYTPKLKKRTALVRALKEVFRRHRSQPIERVIALINPVLRGLVNYFAVGHSSECFSFIKDWVEKKVRRHLAHAQKRKGFEWERWNRRWLYDTTPCASMASKVTPSIPGAPSFLLAISYAARRSPSRRTAVAPVLGFENREKKSPANKPIRRMSRRT